MVIDQSLTMCYGINIGLKFLAQTGLFTRNSLITSCHVPGNTRGCCTEGQSPVHVGSIVSKHVQIINRVAGATYVSL